MAPPRLLLLLLLLTVLLLAVDSARRPSKKKPSRPKPSRPKPNKKPSRPSKPGKPVKPGKKPSKPKPKPTAIFDKYTKKRTGGVCWWDVTRTDCAVCRSNTQPPAVQCGAPMHNYCYRRSEEGCPWVAGAMAPYKDFAKYTLSTQGYPCFWDHGDYSCAWCTPGSYQCGPSKRAGNLCAAAPFAFNNVCDGQRFGCEHIPTCHMDAACVSSPQDKMKVCRCNPGFVGNGIQCKNKATGTVAVAPDTTVTVTASFGRNFVTENNGDFPEQSELMSAIEGVHSVCGGAFSSCTAQLNISGSG